ncbi:hypothetical protein MIMGU_mgv1a0140932mg, partial [Erythranthe guttata]
MNVKIHLLRFHRYPLPLFSTPPTLLLLLSGFASQLAE